MLSINIKKSGILKVKSEFMYPVLLHIYGPFNINSYGVTIAIGVILFIKYAFSDPIRKKIIDDDQFFSCIQGAILAGIIGGKILDIAVAWENYESLYDIFEFWQGGFSALGAVLGVSIYLLYYLNKYGVPVLKFSDVCALYAPLIQIMGRLGCFFAGCCYGVATSVPWAITYTNPALNVPLCVALHPTQLYSALILLALFVGLQIIVHYKKQLEPGLLFGLYAFFMSAERFLVDFWRADRQMITAMLSIYQLIAIGLCIAAGGLIVWLLRPRVYSL